MQNEKMILIQKKKKKKKKKKNHNQPPKIPKQCGNYNFLTLKKKKKKKKKICRTSHQLQPGGIKKICAEKKKKSRTLQGNDEG